VEDAFKRLAPCYDAATRPFHPLRERVADCITPCAGLRLLDVATGTGAQALAFAGRGYLVAGADLSEAMIRVAQGKNSAGKVMFEIADATRLPFLNGSFDASCISFALHDMPRAIRKRVLREMARVTKPGGTVLIVDYGLPESRVGRFLVFRCVALYEAEYYREFIQSDVHKLLSEARIEVLWEASALWGAARIIKGLTARETDG
jgi:demethylmenaquinone methyltransferase/2-methoxy-6-polyprenyl-1,4-benzoquinol methylase